MGPIEKKIDSLIKEQSNNLETLEILFNSEFDSITFSEMYQFVFFETIHCPHMTILLSSQLGLNHFYRF